MKLTRRQVPMKIQQYNPVFNKEEIANELSKYALGDGFYTEYKKTAEFENKIAEFLGVKHCFCVNNGTISLSLALLALGIGPGDRVAVPNITMIATSNAVRLIGAIPIFFDIDENNLCLNLNKVKEAIKYDWFNLKAVIYVTLNGRSHEYEDYYQFQEFCKVNKVAFIEDNAQSFGSYYSNGFNISCPIYGIGSFSFSMPKIITTGQGGCLVTNNNELADKIKKLKDFGRTGGGIDIHDSFGINSKFTELQAILGLSQIGEIVNRIRKKVEINCIYRKLLKHVKQVNFVNYNNHLWIPWFIDIFVDDRNELQTYLKENDIGTRTIYPELTSQKINRKFLYPKTLNISGEYSRMGLWLPSSLDITVEEIEFVCKKIKDFYAK